MELENLDPSEVRKKYLTHRQMSGRLIPGILGVVRELEGEQMTALFNFAEEDRTAWIEEEGEYMDLYTGKKVSLQAIKMEGHSFVLAKKC